MALKEQNQVSKYWIVKNCWSTTQGKNGYVKMAKDQNNAGGIAAIWLCEMIVIKKDLIENKISRGGILS